MSRDGENEQSSDLNGIAKSAKISFLDISLGGDFLNPPADANDLFDPGRTAGASVHVASWGANIGLNSYSTFSSEYDKYLFDHPDMVFVVAAGNFGQNGISFPGTSKNSITVGAVNSLGPPKLLDMSGAGIVEGNRKKPDIVAPGVVFSAFSGGTCDDQLWKEGTSMSTPVVGGAVALIRQYFEEHTYNSITSPSASLVKAILLNGAQPVYGTPYDHRQNFGLANLIESLPLENENSFSALFYNLVEIQDGQTIQYNVTIDQSNQCNSPLSATLVWHDISTSPYILNDLDLVILHKNDTFYPNGLLNKDEANNVERIRIYNANQNESYSIKVHAYDLVLSSIQFSLVVTGCFKNEYSNAENNDNAVEFRNIENPLKNMTEVRNIENQENETTVFRNIGNKDYVIVKKNAFDLFSALTHGQT